MNDFDKDMITSYKDMPLGIYQRIVALNTDAGDNDLGIVSLLSGRTEDELLDMPLAEYRTIKDGCNFLFFEPKAAPLRRTYSVGGFTLVRPKDYRQIVTAQYIDYKEYAAMGGDRSAELLSVLLVPEGKAYNKGYDITEVQDAIREHLSILDALALLGFFLRRLWDLMTASLTSSETMIREAGLTEGDLRNLTRMLREARLSVNGGAGFGRWTPSPSLPGALLRRSTI